MDTAIFQWRKRFFVAPARRTCYIKDGLAKRSDGISPFDRMMNSTLRTVAAILEAAGIENHGQEARWICEDAASDGDALRIARRRADGEPLQYLLGTAPFRDLMLKVDPRALIPRPETELLAGWLIRHAPPRGSILDLGCGSGAIALAVASERPDLSVTAADISRDALDLAMENAESCRITGVEFILSDLFSALDRRKFSLIGANLPYVSPAEYPDLPDEVRRFEPKLALTAPEAGFALIRQTIADAPRHLLPGGGIILELSPPQASEAVELLAANGFEPSVIRDLCGRDRFAAGVLP